MMSSPKVAFLYPTNMKNNHGAAKPVLVYDSPEIPFSSEIHFQAYFLGFKHNEPYWISYQLFKEEPNAASPLLEKGVWLRARGNEGDNDLSASAGLSLGEFTFNEPGHYFIKATVHHNKMPLHSQDSYFKVDLVNE